ncbi:hypothetical protein FDG95_gp327 [Pectobacterium phage vB_PcaM_CBB]|uniref:Uncharacterized protein n=1 Tax=Pectobacterium phage vB_PcaM_CBB TaxID=2772511 RepID=A0A1L2CV26_9CAUD|nr:hypothetical protein FDG95_gp327 [Pectobacterium phage vB_PcaM_CBB]AMM43890.1 hypothetical protein CBB_327 [Pectobacterium phage vB_PcaM_CBB]
MFHPFFDPSSLSNQELHDKINEVSMRIASARAAGIQYEVIQSMFTVIQSCEEELRTRQAKVDLDEVQKENNHCVFDSDSYINTSDEKKNESTRKQNYKRAW